MTALFEYSGSLAWFLHYLSLEWILGFKEECYNLMLQISGKLYFNFYDMASAEERVMSYYSGYVYLFCLK